MFSDKDYSYYDGIPKKFITLKDKKFKDWEIPPWNLLIYSDKLLGEGEFGKVYLADWNGTQVVAKIINEDIPQEKKDLFIKEFDVMTKIHHPNVVQLMGYISEPRLIIVMEYLSNGELLKYIQKKGTSKKKKIKIALDILKALTYLHNRKPKYIVHRDIKPQNIVMTPSGRAKIADFGISRVFDSYNDKMPHNKSFDNIISESEDELTKFVGSIRYMSPEIKNEKIYDYKVDIWSTGIILAELFENKRYNEHFYWHKTPKNIKNIIVKHMLRENPEDRLNALELISLFENELHELNNKFCVCM